MDSKAAVRPGAPVDGLAHTGQPVAQAGQAGRRAALRRMAVVPNLDPGLPLFFAPGDLLMIVSGAAIPAASLNPAVVIAATTCSVLVGAFAGRELFAQLGSAVAARIARVLHVSAGLDWLTARVRRGGAPAVFVGRLTPGLRVHTTEAAGLVRMRRTTFLAGLLPAMAVYEGVFMGLGVWQGRRCGRVPLSDGSWR
jgi:membrane protein DedA with SNARE-associated domain